MSKEITPNPINYKRMVFDIAAAATLAYATVQVQGLEHNPEILAQMPSILAGRVNDGMTATFAMPVARVGASLFTLLTRLNEKRPPASSERLVNHSITHSAGVFGILSLGELTQGPLAYSPDGLNHIGTFDVGDIGAFAVGTMAWFAIDRAAGAIGRTASKIASRRSIITHS